MTTAARDATDRGRPGFSPDLLPLVMLLDMDGTLVGKVGSVLCEYDLHRTLGAAAAPASAAASARPKTASVASPTVHKGLRDAIVARLRYGIIRPHVLEFCRGATAIPGVELYVYTASEAWWAAFFVPCIEAALGVRFNRPIFSRDHCVQD